MEDILLCVIMLGIFAYGFYIVDWIGKTVQECRRSRHALPYDAQKERFSKTDVSAQNKTLQVMTKKDGKTI